MNHSEALKEMAVERYLLDELGPDARDAFEEHMFDCQECAMDVRAGVVFIDEAKKQLPKLAVVKDTRQEHAASSAKERRDWFAWLRPAYLAPAFAALLVVVGYQNLVELPGLRSAAEPHFVSPTPLRGATRGSEHQKVATTVSQGLAIPVDMLPVDGGNYASYAFEVVNPQSKVVWSASIPAPVKDGTAPQTLVIPGQMLKNGTYTVKISGVDAQGAQTVVETYVFDLTLEK
jgi:hypothetical protein